jgi:hypothetical protein
VIACSSTSESMIYPRTRMICLQADTMQPRITSGDERLLSSFIPISSILPMAKPGPRQVCSSPPPFTSLWMPTDSPIVPAKLFTHREFAFTLPGDIYIRYNSFNTADDFKKEIVRLTPARFEIGPQYSARVSYHRSVYSQFQP